MNDIIIQFIILLGIILTSALMITLRDLLGAAIASAAMSLLLSLEFTCFTLQMLP